MISHMFSEAPTTEGVLRASQRARAVNTAPTNNSHVTLQDIGIYSRRKTHTSDSDLRPPNLPDDLAC